jgi:hypothetical protein
MNNNSFKLNHLFSVIIGALIGTIVGKSLISVWGNWTVFIGPIVGAICFLFISAPKTTISIIKFSAISAWRIFVVELSYKRVTRDLLIWSRIQFVRTFTSIIGGCLIGVSAAATFFSVALFLHFVINRFHLPNGYPYSELYIFYYIAISFSAFLVIVHYWGNAPLMDSVKLAFLYVNPIAVLFWAVISVSILLFVCSKIFIPWVFSELIPAVFKLVLRFSIYLQDGLRKHGLILGATSASTGALIGQFHEQLWLGGIIGGGVYCIVHGTVWIVASFAKAFPNRFLYGQ